MATQLERQRICHRCGRTYSLSEHGEKGAEIARYLERHPIANRGQLSETRELTVSPLLPELCPACIMPGTGELVERAIHGAEMLSAAPSIPSFAFGLGILSLFSAFAAGLVFLFGGKLSWAGVATCLVNSFIVVFGIGFIAGALYRGTLLHRVVEGRSLPAKLLAVCSFVFAFAFGALVAFVTVRQGGVYLWKWSP